MASRSPVHLWIVGLLSTVWNAFGVYDFVMTQTHNIAHIARMSDAQRAWLDSCPPAIIACWAVGTLGALIGSLLLLTHSRLAVPAFAASLVGLGGLTIYEFGFAPLPADMSTPGAYAFMAAIWAVAIALLVYSRVMARTGALR